MLWNGQAECQDTVKSLADSFRRLMYSPSTTSTASNSLSPTTSFSNSTNSRTFAASPFNRIITTKTGLRLGPAKLRFYQSLRICWSCDRKQDCRNNYWCLYCDYMFDTSCQVEKGHLVDIIWAGWKDFRLTGERGHSLKVYDNQGWKVGREKMEQGDESRGRIWE